MANLNLDVPVDTAVKALTLRINIKGLYVAKLKMWLGAKIIRFGVFVIGCDAEIKVNGDD